MSINSDFTQKVEVFNRSSIWSEVNVSGLSINESVNNPIPEIEFDLYGAEVNNKDDVIDVLSGARLRVTQEVNGTSMIFYCILASNESVRVDHYDIYKLRYYGQEELLTRRRYFYAFNRRDATGVIEEVIRIYNENCPESEKITANGLDVNDSYVGKLYSNYETGFDIIKKVCSITGWVFKIENGDCKFFNPETRLGSFDITYNQNCIGNTLSVNCDYKGIINVAIGEAYIYEEIEVEQTYEECLETIFIDQYNSDIYEIVEPFKIIQPEVFADVNSNVNLDEGSITFEQPLVYDVDGEIDDSRPKQDIEFLGRMVIRKRVLARAQNDQSIALFGERFSAIQKNDGGEDLNTVFPKLESIIKQKAFPLIDGECDITEFGLRAGDFVTVNTGTINPLNPSDTENPDYSFTARITEIDHSTYKNEIRAKVKFSNSFFSGQDPMIQIENRVERLERDAFHTTRLAGEVIRETGYIFKPPVQEVNETIVWSESTKVDDGSYVSTFQTDMDITFDYE